MESGEGRDLSIGTTGVSILSLSCASPARPTHLEHRRGGSLARGSMPRGLRGQNTRSKGGRDSGRVAAGYYVSGKGAKGMLGMSADGPGESYRAGVGLMQRGSTWRRRGSDAARLPRSRWIRLGGGCQARRYAARPAVRSLRRSLVLKLPMA